MANVSQSKSVSSPVHIYWIVPIYGHSSKIVSKLDCGYT